MNQILEIKPGTPPLVADRIRAIIAEQALVPLEAVQLASTLQSLGIDSLGVVETIFAIEEAFDIQVPFNANDTALAAFDLSSVGAIVDAVQSLIDAKSA